MAAARFSLVAALGCLAVSHVSGNVDVSQSWSLRGELLKELRGMEEAASSKSEDMEDLFSVVGEIEDRSSERRNEVSAVRRELIDELRSARRSVEQQERPLRREEGSPLRGELIDELRSARQNVMQQNVMQQNNQDDEAMSVQPPWSDAEELLVDVHMVAQPGSLAAAAVLPVPTFVAEHMLAFNRLLRTLILSGVAFGLASAAKLPELDLKQKVRSPAQWMTLGLFFIPLAAVSADYVLDVSMGNEFAMIGCCWGLAAAMAVHMRFQLEKES